MSKTKSAIDPTSDAVVLAYVGPGNHLEAPSRDLHGGDLARIGYVRRLRMSEESLKTRGKRPAADAGQADVDAIADELVATGNWTRDIPHETTTEPASPADEPEASK